MSPKTLALPDLDDTFVNPKVNDLVIVNSYRAGTHTRRVRKINAVLRLHVMVDGTKYRRSSGHEVGTGFHLGKIEPATKALIKEVRTENERLRLVYAVREAWKEFSPSKADTATLEALLKLLSPAPEARDE